MGWYVVTSAAAKRGQGQPTKRTPERVQIILEALREGLSRETAADLAGIAPRTLRHWEEKDSALSAQVALASAEGEAELWRIIRAKAGTKQKPGDADSAKWMLAKRWPEKYSERARLDVKLETKGMSARELERRIAEHESRRRGVPASARGESASSVEDSED